MERRGVVAEDNSGHLDEPHSFSLLEDDRLPWVLQPLAGLFGDLALDVVEDVVGVVYVAMGEQPSRAFWEVAPY